MSDRELRDYQETDVRRLFAAFKSHRRVCYVLPTGGGKTAVAVRIIQQNVRAGRRVLVLAHRKELVDQMVESLLQDGLESADIGRIRASEETNLDAPVQVASVQTLARRAKPVADLVVVDECHHAVADGWSKILAWYPDAKIVGLTATAIRLDGRGLEAEFDEIVHGPMFSELAKAGHLLIPRVFAPADGPDLTGVSTVAGDYNREELSEEMRKPSLVGDVVAHWLRHAGGRRTVCYAVDRRHARKLVESFESAGVRVEYLDGQTPMEHRTLTIGRGGLLARRMIDVVVNCEVLTEGWDLPEVKCAIHARPTQSLALYNQMSGRIVRPWRETREPRKGSSDQRKGELVTPIILDHAGNFWRHDLPSEDRVFDLHSEKATHRPRRAPFKVCPECDSVQPAGAIECINPNCEHVFEMKDPAETVDGELVDVTRMREEMRRLELERLIAVATKYGRPLDFAARVFRLKFPHPPTTNGSAGA